MVNRNASAVIFGFDFQVNAAIVLMLENIKDMKSIRLEGKSEDIELELKNNQFILAQAKAVVQSSTDFRNVRANLMAALESLSEGARNTRSTQLIFITNSPNPFNDELSRGVFYGHTHRDFKDIPNSAQQIINRCLAKIKNPLNPEHLTIQVLPFETDNKMERYKVIKQCVENFIGGLGLNDFVLGNRLLPVWQEDVFKNGAMRDTTIKLSKEDIVWPIIAILTDLKSNTDYLDDLDFGSQDEVKQKYADLINTYTERIELFTRILYDFNVFSCGIQNKQNVQNFVETKWKEYASEFESVDLESELRETLIKTILHIVICTRHKINKIKQGTGL